MSNLPDPTRVSRLQETTPGLEQLTRIECLCLFDEYARRDLEMNGPEVLKLLRAGKLDGSLLEIQLKQVLWLLEDDLIRIVPSDFDFLYAPAT